MSEKQETVAERMNGGNGAKMREALVNISKYADCAAMRQHDATTQHYIEQIRKWAEAALATPRKNCERFQTWDEAKDAYWREQGDPCDWRKLGAWLFAPEGGAK